VADLGVDDVLGRDRHGHEAVPVSVLTIDTLRQRAAGKAGRLKAGGPSREVEIGRAAASFFVPDWPCELRYRLLPSDKTVIA